MVTEKRVVAEFSHNYFIEAVQNVNKKFKLKILMKSLKKF